MSSFSSFLYGFFWTIIIILEQQKSSWLTVNWLAVGYLLVTSSASADAELKQVTNPQIFVGFLKRHLQLFVVYLAVIKCEPVSLIFSQYYEKKTKKSCPGT